VLIKSARSVARIAVLGVLFACAGLVTSGCAGNYGLALHSPAIGGPGAVAQYALVPAGSLLSWFEPIKASDRASLDRWRRAVGPPVIAMTSRPYADRPVEKLIVVSWNTAVGSADVVRFVRSLRSGSAERTPVVLLLQEVYRSSTAMPRSSAATWSFASRLGADSPGDGREDVETIAAATGMNAYYVPSMRNGSPRDSDEDRGNAILSDLPLSNLSAIELPFEQQRRVAVAASISGVAAAGAPWTLQLVSAHLDNLVGGRRLWLAGSEYARIRQARSLAHHLSNTGPTLLAGDFNTWFGFADGAYAELARAFPGSRPVDRRATFRGLLRLDHLFFRLPDGWHAEYRRGDDRFGSDHFPLIATVKISEGRPMSRELE
jgi:endonuclease/exonuclease/phosphatase family metal-dependent hydrolase